MINGRYAALDSDGAICGISWGEPNVQMLQDQI